MKTRSLYLLFLSVILICGCRSRKEVPANFKKTGSLDSRIQPYMWQAVGPFGSPVPMAAKGEWSAHGTGRFECIDIHPDNENEILLGHATAGLFKSTDGGRSWVQKLKFEFATGIFDIVRFRKDRQHLLACCATDAGIDKAYGYGLIESFDGGETWQRNSLQYRPYEYNLKQQRGIAIADKRSELRLLSISNHSIYLSEDGGLSWNIVHTVKEDLKTIQVDPQDDRNIVVTGNVLLISTDGGATWEDKTAAICTAYGSAPGTHIRYEAAFSSKHTNRLWIAVSHNGTYLLHTDVPAFREFKLLGHGQFAGNIYHMSMALLYSKKQNSEQLLIGTTRLFRSRDEGQTFEQISTPETGTPASLHDDINRIKVSPDGHLFVCTDGGADRSDDEGNTWKSITNASADLNASLLFGFDKAKNGCILAGTQDKGIFKFMNDSWWSCKMYGDGGRVVAMDDSNSFACGYQKMCYVTRDAGRSFTYHHAGGDINFFDFSMDYVRQTGSLFITNQQLYKQEKGKNFRILSSTLQAERPIGALWVNHENDDEIWLSRMDATWGGPLVRKLYYTSVGGANWQDKTSALPILQWRSITDIAVNTNGDIAVTLGGFDAEKGGLNKVYVSTDGGNSFENISEGLGNYPVTCIEAVGNSWVCGNANGIYIKNRGETWQKLGNEFPTVIVSDIRYMENDKLLYVSTFGRGLWRLLMN